jgi:hypothetical protein
MNVSKIAVIGTGRMGSVHTRNIARFIPEADLVAPLAGGERAAGAALLWSVKEAAVKAIGTGFHQLADDDGILRFGVLEPDDDFVIRRLHVTGERQRLDQFDQPRVSLFHVKHAGQFHVKQASGRSGAVAALLGQLCRD